ncbi:transcription factor E2F7 isoform X2 [Rhipicephalus sanguineus]|nr:transcription factor E2F7 isoform X2 [Rhipicephalus sanguineus]
MSEYCLQPCSTNQNIMFVRTREPIADDVFSPASSPKRLCLDTESPNSCDVDAIARIMTPTPPSESPVKRPLQDVTLRCNNSGSSSPSLSPSPGTPTKSGNDFLGSPSDDPMTPTARLKLLSRLAAERLPYASGENGMDDELSNHSSNSENQRPTSRKEKSLGLLCQAFLALYPEYTEPSDNIIVSLDEVAKHLGVERRRVYDIVNVLESVGMVTKEAKNKYRWFGKGALLETLPKLKALSEKSNIAGQIHSVKDFEFNHSLEMSSQLFVVPSNEAINSGQVTAASMAGDSGGVGGGGAASVQDLELRREKSMGIMSQRFLMLFLTSPPKTVSLDLAAKVLIGDPTVDKTQSLVYKTKIRRLYDIANILTSLGLIRKVTVTESRGRKSAFKYIGPDIGTASTDEDVQVQTQSRHSLVATGFSFKKISKSKDENSTLRSQSPGSNECTAQVLELLQRTQERSKRGSSRLMRTHSDDISAPSRKCRRGPQLAAAAKPASSSSKSLARHASFHDICEVAEMERRRLYSEEEENHRELSTRDRPAGDGNAVTDSEKSFGDVESGIGAASPSKVRTSNAKQAEAKESELSASTESHVITLSEEQYTSLLQSLNLPIHSKPIISIQQEKKAEQPCKCSGSQQPQTPQPTVPRQTMALQTPAQQKPAQQVPVVQTSLVQTPTLQTPALQQTPAQETPGQQTTTVLAATDVPTILTPTFRWIIEHDQRTPSGNGGTEEVITALALPAAARKLTYDSVPTTPASPGAAEESLVLSITSAEAADDSTLKLPTTTAGPAAGTVTPLTPNYYACFVRAPSSSPEVLPLVTTGASSSSPQIPIFSPTNCMLTLSPVVLGAAHHGQAAMSTITFPAGTRLLTATTPGAAPTAAEKKVSTAARKLTLTK